MTALQKKVSKLLWTTRWEEIFEKLQYILITAPILRIVDPDGDFIVFTESRKEGLGGFLLQNDHTICYESWKLKEHEKN